MRTRISESPHGSAWRARCASIAAATAAGAELAYEQALTEARAWLASLAAAGARS